MNKQEFLAALKNKLSHLPEEDRRDQIVFYGEMIDDRMEEGLSEAAAVAAIGSIEQIAEQILQNAAGEPSSAKKRKRGAWEITLLILGAPLWLALLIAALAVAISLIVSLFAILISAYAVLWSVPVSLWAAFGGLVGGTVGGFLGGFLLLCLGNAPSGAVLIGGGLVCAGLSILLLLGCKAVTRGTLYLSALLAKAVARCFRRKETN